RGGYQRQGVKTAEQRAPGAERDDADSDRRARGEQFPVAAFEQFGRVGRGPGRGGGAGEEQERESCGAADDASVGG
ncbi:MAG: hypothetical protein R6X14_06700, partial [bacterium]